MFTENKISEFQNKISELADRPQMSAQALKAYFDGSAEEIRQKYNALVDALDAFAAGSFDAVSYSAADGKLTFIFGDGSTQVIDLPLELLVKSGHYDAEKQSIVLTLANEDVLEIPVSDLVNEYEADEKTLHMTPSEVSKIFSVKDGVFAPEAPSDNKVYARKAGKWKEIIEGLPEITLAEAESVADGLYVVTDACGDWAMGTSENPLSHALLIAGTEEYGGGEAKQQLLVLPNGELWRRLDMGAWQSVIPSLAEYAKTAYVDEIANKSNYETILEGELTEGGVSEITTLIPVDLTQYKQLQFYAKVNVAEVESGTSCLHVLSICDKNHAAYNSGLIYLPVTNNGKTSYVWDCESNIYKTENEHVFLTKFSIIAGFGNSFATNPRALAANIKTSNITNQSYPPHLSMRITNTTFEAGTKYYLRGIR